MKTEIRVLLLEDNRADAELVQAFLKTAGFAPEIRRVDTRREFEQALKEFPADIIISDFSLPSYNGLSALSVAKALQPGTPFIFYSGTMGEEAAIEALKNGALDYVLKERPQRLGPAIQRALNEARQRQQHREAEAQILALASLLDMASDAVIMRDVSDKVLFWNRGASRIYGYDRIEAVGQPIINLLYEADDEVAFRKAKEATLATGEWSGELRQRAKDGRAILVASRWTLMRSADGEPERILVMNSDITEKRALEKQFLRAQRMECVGTLASGVAHDLNNVLAPILMGTEVLKLCKLDQEAQDMLETISMSAQRGADIVKQVLTFVRGAEGQRTQLNLKHVIRDVGNLAAKTFPKNIQVDVHVSADLWTVKGDATQLHQVLMNLAINARDAMPNGGRLKLTAKNGVGVPATKPHIAITVEDSGVGMSPEVVDRIFEPFFTTKEPGKGTGLGLSTALGIIQSHGGSIHVKSESGQGTAFQLAIPADVASALPQEERPKLPVPKGNGELILIVDDEPAIRGLVAQALWRHGYRTITADDGNLGILQFATSKEAVKLLITDIMMPAVDGTALAKNIASMKPYIPIIAISGLSEHERIPEAQHFLKKPFSTEALLRLVHEVLTAPVAPSSP